MSVSTAELPALHTTGTFPELAVYNHGLRMDAVITALSRFGTRHLIDVGCGDGALARKLAASDLNVDDYLGIDTWCERLDSAQTDKQLQDDRMQFRRGSMTELRRVIRNPEPFRRLGAVVLLETIEHVPRSEVRQVEDGVFGHIAPELVVITTPDATTRLTGEKLRARGHHFEWDIPEFKAWAISVTDTYPKYTATISQLSGPTFMRNSQIALFSRDA